MSLAVGLALLAATPAIQAALVGHWTFDESPVGNGGTVADSSGITVHDGLLGFGALMVRNRCRG